MIQKFEGNQNTYFSRREGEMNRPKENRIKPVREMDRIAMKAISPADIAAEWGGWY